MLLGDATDRKGSPVASRKAVTRYAALAVASLVGASAVIGCGGGGGDDTLSKDALVKDTNAVCKRHTQRIRAASGKLLAGGKLPEPKQFGRLARETIVPQVSGQVSELRKLKPPEDLSDDYERWLDESKAARDRMAEDPAAITNPANFRKVNQQADELGLSSDCHIGPS